MIISLKFIGFTQTERTASNGLQQKKSWWLQLFAAHLKQIAADIQASYPISSTKRA